MMLDFLYEYPQSEEEQANYEEIRSIIDSFNIEELRNLLKQEDNEIRINKRLRDYLSEIIEQHLAKVVTELQTNPKYDCSQLLDFLLESTRTTPLQGYALFRGSEKLLKIIEYTEDLHIYDLVSSILQKCSIEMIRKRIEILPRILYLSKILYSHINFLSSRKINLIDYYYQDPKYRELCKDPIDSLQFDFEYYEPTQLDESYEELQNNFSHKKKLEGQLLKKKISIEDENSTSALTLARNLLNMQNQPFSPLIEIVKYRILIKRGLQTDPQKTRNIIMGLHLKSLSFIEDDRIPLQIKKCKRCYNQIIGELEQTDNYNLFQLETIDPMSLVELITNQSQNIKLSNNERYLDYLQKLVSDVLSMSHIEQNEFSQGYPLKYNSTILSQQLVTDSKLTSCILKTVARKSFNNELLLSSDIVKMLITVLNIQDNKLMLPPEQLGEALLLFNTQSLRDQETLNQNSDDLLSIIGYYINQGQNLQKPTLQGYVQINNTEADSIMIRCIKIIFNNFQFMQIYNTQHVNQTINIDTLLANKILNSNILNSLANKLTQQVEFTNTAQSALQFISCLANTDPSLIERIINSKVPVILNDIIQRIKIEELDFNKTKDILRFYQYICIQEKGFQLFQNQAIRLIHDLLHYNLVVVQGNIKMQWTTRLGIMIDNFINYNNRMETQLIETLQQIYQQVLEQLTNRIKNLKFDQDGKIEFKKIVQKKTTILSFNNNIYLNGKIDVITRFFKIPSFNNFYYSQINPPRIIETVLQLIESWEGELGQSLDNAQFQYLDEKNFFDQFSSQNLTTAARLSELFHYLSAITPNGVRTAAKDLKCKLLEKLCPLFGMVIIAKDYEQLKNVQSQISDVGILIGLFGDLIRLETNEYLESIGRFFDKLSQYLVSSPNATIQLLILINTLLNIFGPPFQTKLQILLINSSFTNNLLDALKNQNRIDQQNSTMTKVINDNFEKLLRMLYEFPKRKQDQVSILPKIIQNISSLYQIFINSDQENPAKFTEFLTTKINQILDPHFLKRNQNYNPEFINRLEEMGYSRQLIFQALDNNNFPHNEAAFVQFVEKNRNLLEQQAIQCDQQQDDLNLELIQTQIESLKDYIKTNILRFPISRVFFLNFSGIQFDQMVLFKYLQQTAYQQFNLQLSFQGVEFENSNSPPWSIVVILKLLSKQKHFTQQQDLIAIEMIKILEMLLQQPEICRYGIQAINLTLSILTKLISNNQEILNLLLNGIKKILDLKIQDQIIVQLCIDVLIKVFSKNRQSINRFIQEFEGLELLYKLSGNSLYHTSIFGRLAIGIVSDRSILRAQIEAKIKKIIFDQENNEEIQKTNENTKSLYFQNENAYPICLQPTQYNVQANKQWKIQKKNPHLLALQNDELFKEEVKEVMNILFIESEEEQCYILKNGIGLDTLNSINNNNDSISQVNFKHTKETQMFMKFLVQKLISSYFDTNTQKQFDWKPMLEVLLFLVSKFSILLPLLLRINCCQYLKQYKHQIGYEQQELPTNISFLSLIIRFIQPSHNFLFYICLDNIILFRKPNNIIVPFGNEIRRIIIKQLYSEICKSIKTFDEKLKSLTFILGILLQIKSVAKICIKNINEPQDSFNFINVFIEGIKNLDLQQYFIYKDQIYFILTILNLLYNVATCFLFEKNTPTITNQHQQNMMNQSKQSQRGKKIIGEMQLEEMQNQLFSFDKGQLHAQRNSPPKISKLYLLQWPLFTVENLQKWTQKQEELIPNDQLHSIKVNQQPQEISAIDLEHEENQFIDEIVQETKEQSSNNIQNDKVLNDFVDAFIDDKIELNFQFTEILNQLLLPKQFQHHLIKLRDLLIQYSPEILSNQQRVLQEDDNRNRIPARFRDNSIIQVRRRLLPQNHIFQGNLQNYNLRIINENIERNVDDNFAEFAPNDNFPDEHEGDQLQFLQVQQQQTQQQQINQNTTLQNINSILKNRRHTIENLGKLDNQFIQFLLKFLYIEDVGANLNSVSNFLKTAATKLLLTNQIINDLIQILKQMTQNVQLENKIVAQQEPVHDCKYPLELVKIRVLNLMLDLQKLQSCNLSANNLKELICLIEFFQGEQLNLLIQFMNDQEQISIVELSQYQINSLFNNMLKEKDLEISNNYINFISKLLVVSQNRKLFFQRMGEVVQDTTEYYKTQLENKNTSDSSFNKINEVEKIFQLLHIAYKQGVEEQSSCEKFLNSVQVENLMKLTEQVISVIPKEQVQKYHPALVPVFSVLVISNQILNPNNPEQLNILTKLASMEISNSLSGSLEIRDVDFESLSREICKKGKFFINYIIKQKLLLLNRQRNNRHQQHSENLHDFEFQNLYVDYFFQNHSIIIDFENKKLYFDLKMRNRQYRKISVRRTHIFEDSYNKIKNCDPQQLRNVQIQFEGENGVDLGGLSKEWMQLLTKEIVDPNNKLFVPTSNTQFCQINRESYQDPDHLNKFKFVGRIFAIAITNRLKVFGRFPISFFKHIIGQKLSIVDISYHDQGLYQQFYSLYYNKCNTNFEQYFLYTIINNGKPEDVELKQGGGDILVTEENKKEFIKMYCHQIMAKNIENQMKAFQEGFYSIIPRQYINIFDSTQLEQLLCGQTYIDVKDLIKHLQYVDYAPDHQAIIWLQNTLKNFNQDLLAKFLKFVTSLPLAPIGGFQNQEKKIEIRKFNCDLNKIDQVLPVGHTCLNQLELPPYSQEQILAAKLELAITEGSEEFSLA